MMISGLHYVLTRYIAGYTDVGCQIIPKPIFIVQNHKVICDELPFGKEQMKQNE